MNIVITGTAGYIGGMLADQYSQQDDIECVICIDKDPQPDWLQNNNKLHWIQAHLLNDEWEHELSQWDNVQVVIHCAWQIRDWYGKRSLVREWNIESARRVFDYVFNNPSVQCMVYFSSIAQFGAVRSNTVERRFTEESPTRLTGYCYADDKYEVDQLLQEMYVQSGSHIPVTVIKPSTVTGPRGRVGVGKFSLAAALSSDADKSQIPWIIRLMLSFMPIVGRWTRQFVHEDDITDVVSIGAFTSRPEGIQEYIVSPHDIIKGRDMSRMMGKIGVWVPGWAAACVFWIAWHTTRGRVPTAPHVWRYFAYPICVDGSKTERELRHEYRYTSQQAISELQGRYAPK